MGISACQLVTRKVITGSNESCFGIHFEPVLKPPPHPPPTPESVWYFLHYEIPSQLIKICPCQHRMRCIN